MFTKVGDGAADRSLTGGAGAVAASRLELVCFCTGGIIVVVFGSTCE
jgi:hypothetical protein